jgi:hypothetical protein
MHAVLLRGWAVLPGVALAGTLSGWRRRGPTGLIVGRWGVVQPVPGDQPIGAVCRLVVVPADAEVDLMPGSQGIQRAPPTGAEPTRIQLADGQALVFDARCWLRVTRSTGEIATWEQD